MRFKEFFQLYTEGRRNKPTIVVDVQPQYSGIFDGDENPLFEEIISFVNSQTGPVLMFVNAEDTGLTSDTIDDIKVYWEDSGFTRDWNDVEIIDKGYGYLRSWMDRGESPSVIIKVIREMYRQKVSDSRELYGGELNTHYDKNMRSLIGSSFREFDLDDPISVNWVSVAKLKSYSPAYLVGGGRKECLEEVELMMNAFNIRYRRVDNLIY
jgi:hypothetical protein